MGIHNQVLLLLLPVFIFVPNNQRIHCFLLPFINLKKPEALLEIIWIEIQYIIILDAERKLNVVNKLFKKNLNCHKFM